jgi:hypothetical protein
MRPNSQFVALVLFALGVSSVKAVTPEKITDSTLDILKEEMTRHAEVTYAELCEVADTTGQPVYFGKNHPYWKEAGFSEMNGPARTIFRRLQKHFGRELVFVRGSMIVFPHENILIGRGKKTLVA